MRLDKYLKVSRIIKRRTIANEVCDAGKVMVNSKPARASYNVKEGDKVPVVLDGGRVAGGHEPGQKVAGGVKIKKGKLRGVESNGMLLCAEKDGKVVLISPEKDIESGAEVG